MSVEEHQDDEWKKNGAPVDGWKKHRALKLELERHKLELKLEPLMELGLAMDWIQNLKLGL